jgi:hypothetical protein
MALIAEETAGWWIQGKLFGLCDNQHNDIHDKDIQHNHIQHNDIQYDDSQHKLIKICTLIEKRSLCQATLLI